MLPITAIVYALIALGPLIAANVSAMAEGFDGAWFGELADAYASRRALLVRLPAAVAAVLLLRRDRRVFVVAAVLALGLGVEAFTADDAWVDMGVFGLPAERLYGLLAVYVAFTLWRIHTWRAIGVLR